jgi:FG-GAP repeat
MRERLRVRGSGLPLLLAIVGAATSGAEPRTDFDSDGFADLVVGVPREDVGDLRDAGAVDVLYGSPGGPGAERSLYLTQATSALGAQSDAEFGAASTTGDFDGDGFTDLAVGAPGYDEVLLRSNGSVVLFWGSATGLDAARNGFLTFFRDGAHYGAALAAGDFDGNGIDDLAVGLPGWDPDVSVGLNETGAVEILYGTPFGFGSLDHLSFVNQDTRRVKDRAEENDRFGASLASGDFDADGHADLAIGVPGEDANRRVQASVNVGAVSVLHGSEDGLSNRGDQLWSQFKLPGGGRPEEDDSFGATLATGDLDGDCRDDLAIAASGSDAVHVLFGARRGLSSRRARGYRGAPSPRLGSALAIGDFEGDGIGDLAKDALGGAVVARGTEEGLIWDNPLNDTLELYKLDFLYAEFPEHHIGDYQGDAALGAAAAADDYNGDGRDDLALGSPAFDIVKRGLVGISNAGAVGILFGQSSGPLDDEISSDPDDVYVVQTNDVIDDPDGIEAAGEAEPDDQFGAVLATAAAIPAGDRCP